MTDPSKEDLKALEAKATPLRGYIESLEKMARRGRNVSESLELASAEARIKIGGRRSRGRGRRGKINGLWSAWAASGHTGQCKEAV